MTVTRGIREARADQFWNSKWGWEAFVQNGAGTVPCAHLHSSPMAALACGKKMLEAAGHETNAPDVKRRKATK